MKKIVILGPESTGKSTLCQQLAAHYNTVWCAEYAREYLLKNGTEYSFNDLLTIAKGQLALEESLVASRLSLDKGNPTVFSNNQRLAINAPAVSNDQLPTTNDHIFSNYQRPTTNDLLFIDTDQYVMKVWCEYVFGDCHTWILNRIVERPYDLYLLCKPDLPWVKDELREYPNEKPRQELYRIYKDIMINQNTPWIDISGGYDERLQKAIAAIDERFS